MTAQNSGCNKSFYNIFKESGFFKHETMNLKGANSIIIFKEVAP